MRNEAKLLRVLEEGKVLRVGATRETPVDVRVLAASNRPLEKAVREGALREDLLFRLNVFPVHLPPLRERIEDLPLLIEHFIQKTNARHGKQITGIDDGCLSVLAAYWWPGNIRELKHVIERAAVVCESATLTANDLPSEVQLAARPESSFSVHLGSSVREVVDELIWRTIAYAGGSKARAAKILGVGRRTIYSHIGQNQSYKANGHSTGHQYRHGRNGLT
jgi:two-component system, NtrC family, response regulator HydG